MTAPAALAQEKGAGDDTARRQGWQQHKENLTRKQKMNLAFATMRTVRTTWESRWADSAAHADPYGFLLTPMMANQGFKKDGNLLDTTPLKARKILKSGMFTSLTPSASQWFKCRHPDPVINKISPVQEWNEYTTTVMERIFDVSNYYNQAPDYFDKAGTYAVGAMLIDEDFDKYIQCTVFPTGSFWASCNAEGFVDTFLYQVRMTVREVVEKFCTDEFTGEINLDNCSKALTNYWNSHQYEAPIDIIHFLGPRSLYGGSDGRNLPDNPYKPGSPWAKEMKYGSWRYEWSLNAESMTGMENAFGDVFLSEGGYDEFPALVTPWGKTSILDAYGSTSPGLDALPDERELFFARSQMMMIEEKIQSPVMTGNPLYKSDDYNDLPGAFNPMAPNTENGQRLQPAYEIRPEALTSFEKRIENLQQATLECWDANTFQLLSNYENMKDVTAAAVMELKAEKMQKLGAIYGTFNDHYLKPLFKLVFHYAWKRGLIPPPPKEMGGQKPIPELLGTMAQAMKLSGLAAKERFVEFGAKLDPLAQVPTLANEINFGRIWKDVAEDLSMPQEYFNTDEEKAAIQKAAADAAKQKQMQEALPQVAGATKDLANAPTDQPSALSALMGNNQAAQ